MFCAMLGISQHFHDHFPGTARRSPSHFTNPVGVGLAVQFSSHKLYYSVDLGRYFTLHTAMPRFSADSVTVRHVYRVWKSVYRQAGFWSGDLILRDLRVRADATRKLRMPIVLKQGSVDCVRLQVSVFGVSLVLVRGALGQIFSTTDARGRHDGIYFAQIELKSGLMTRQPPLSLN